MDIVTRKKRCGSAGPPNLMSIIPPIIWNVSFPNTVTALRVNTSHVNKSNLGANFLYTSYFALGFCGSQSGTAYTEDYKDQDRTCASYDTYTEESFKNTDPMPFVNREDYGKAFGNPEAVGTCIEGKACNYDRIYPHIDECRAYALENKRHYWLVITRRDLKGEGWNFMVMTACFVCTADAVIYDATPTPPSPPDGDIRTQNVNVCSELDAPPSPLPPSPPASPSEGSLGVTIGIGVGVGVAVVGVGVAVAWYTGYLGARPPATPTLSKFPATFEVNLGGLTT